MPAIDGRSQKKPGEPADRAAGCGRADQPAQRLAQDRADGGDDDNEERIDRIEKADPVGEILAVRRLRRRRGQRLAVDHGDDARDAGGNAAGEIAAAKFRRDHLVDDAPRGDVGEAALEAVADLDAELVVVLGDHQQRAIVDLLAPDLPGFRDPDRILLDALRLRGRHDQHRDLAALAQFQVFQAFASARRCRRCQASRSGRPRGR